MERLPSRKRQQQLGLSHADEAGNVEPSPDAKKIVEERGPDAGEGRRCRTATPSCAAIMSKASRLRPEKGFFRLLHRGLGCDRPTTSLFDNVSLLTVAHPAITMHGCAYHSTCRICRGKATCCFPQASSPISGRRYDRAARVGGVVKDRAARGLRTSTARSEFEVLMLRTRRRNRSPRRTTRISTNDARGLRLSDDPQHRLVRAHHELLGDVRERFGCRRGHAHRDRPRACTKRHHLDRRWNPPIAGLCIKPS